MPTQTALLNANYINGTWESGTSSNTVQIINPATQESLAEITLAEEADTNRAIAAAAQAFPSWRRTPPQDRIQFMFKFRELLIAHADEIARTTTRENGKTFAEARAELARGIENVEVSCGMPT